jgi:hypothetical protein
MVPLGIGLASISSGSASASAAPWTGAADSGFPVVHSHSAEAYSIGVNGDHWQLYVTHPLPATGVSFTGTIIIDAGSFTHVHGLKLETPDTYTNSGTVLTFNLENFGRVDGLAFTTPSTADLIVFDLNIAGSPATTSQILLGTTDTPATTSPVVIPRTVSPPETTLPTIPTTLPPVPTTLPTIPTTLPPVPTTLPTIPTTLPTVPPVPTTLPTLP